MVVLFLLLIFVSNQLKLTIMGTTKQSKLKVGDFVMWRGAFGSEPQKRVKVEGIQKCPSGSKSGRDVNSVDWSSVNSRTIVVDLDNGHWAYGTQLKQIINL